ncbi:MAG: 8-amino-7-oxononanoate synthase [Planctomycetes bacterium]|nr:8-amino-7-oxononanoate synthase [Planctomycetota bacterium]MCL4731073.1 8-amino-7-oxononanoate synthase [Planctomycetota bacterium]
MIPKPWQELLAKRREERVRQRLVRRLRSLRHMGSTRVQLGSRDYVNFSSNDYLGLAGDLRIAEAAAAAAGRFGWGTGASRLVTGTSTLHQKLEQEVARFRGTEAALVFGSGYQANLGVLSALLDKGDLVLSDEYNHASIVAGCRLSGATVRVFKHRDYEDLERKLAGTNPRKLVVTDTLFSIEGDTADLPRIVKLCERHGALLMIDDAHANAALGKKGRGLAEYQNVLAHVPIVVGTFSKALGSYGGFVACSEELREFLVNESRPFIYTTAMPIALAAANIEALRIVQKDGEALRQKLHQHVKSLRSRLENQGFELTGYHHIVGIRVGDPERVMFLAEEVEKQGILTYPMRWPSVPRGRDTLRVSVSAAHTEDELVRLASALRLARDRMGGKETTILVKREAKRPTHPNLDIAATEDLDESAFAAAHDSGSEGGPEGLPPAQTAMADFAPPPGGPGDTMIETPSAPELQVSSSGRLPVVDSSESGGFEALLEDVMNEAAEPQPSGLQPVVISEAVIAPVAASAQEPPAAPPPAPPSEPAAGPAPSPATAAEPAPAIPKTEAELPPVPEPPPAGDSSATIIPDGANVPGPGSGDTLAPEQTELPDPEIVEIEGGTRRRKREKTRRRTRRMTRAVRKD